jgi:two-component system OmpR family response regulator
MATILVADDDPHIREVVAFALEKSGHRIVPARDGDEALALARSGRPDLVVLDVGMPGEDGLSVCRRLRADPAFAELPVLFLSARDEEVDRILGLEMGGDDYVTKPFSPRELVARVTAILRRSAGRGTETAEPVLAHGRVRLDPARAEARCDDTLVALTAQELSILKVLLARPGVVFDRTRIVDLAYPGNIHVSDRTIDSHIRNMRAKFAAAGCADVIETVHGLGFRLGPCSATP